MKQLDKKEYERLAKQYVRKMFGCNKTEHFCGNKKCIPECSSCICDDEYYSFIDGCRCVHKIMQKVNHEQKPALH